MNVADLLMSMTNAQLDEVAEAFSHETVVKILGEVMRQTEAELRMQVCLQAEMATQGKQVPLIIYEVFGAEIKALGELAGIPALAKEMKKGRRKKREEIL